MLSAILVISVFVLFLTVPTLILLLIIFLDKTGNKQKQVSKVSKNNLNHLNHNLELQNQIPLPSNTSSENTVLKALDSNSYTQNKIDQDQSDNTLKYSAEVFLYIGSFLVIFAVFVLVALNWSAISNLIKSFILISVILIFFALGFIFSRIEKIKNVGLTYYTVASLLLPLVFLGLWNFLFLDILNNLNLSIKFSLYWVVVSVISVLANLLLLKFTSKDRFFNLILFSIYSFFVSFAYTLTDDTNFRLLTILFLNLIFYLSESIFGKYTKVVTITSRIVNSVLNIFLFFNIWWLTVNNSYDSFSLYNKILILLAFFAPTLFIVISHIKDKGYFESGLEAFLVISKLNIIINLFLFPNYKVLELINSLSYLILILFYNLIGEFRIKKESKALYYFLLILSGLLLIIYNFAFIINSFFSYHDLYNYFILFSGLFVTLFVNLFIPLKNKNYTVAGLGLTYVIFLITRLIYFFDFGKELKTYIYSYLILGILLGTLYLYFKYIKQYNFARFIHFTFEAFLFFSGLLGLFTFKNVDISTVFLAITAFYFSRALFEKNAYIRLLSYLTFFIGYSGLVNLIYENYHTYKLTVAQTSIFFMTISFLFYIAFEVIIKRFKVNYFPEIFGNVLFGLVGLFMPLFLLDKYVLWINLFLVFLMLSINLVLHKSRITLFFDFVVLQILVILSNYILRLSLVDSLIAIALINFLLGISRFSMPIQNLLNNNQNDVSFVRINLLLNYLNLFTLGYTALLFILFFLEFLFTGNRTYIIVLVLFASTILTAKSFKVQQFAGVPLVVAAWILANFYHLNTQFYIIPITIYGLVLAGIYYFKGRIAWAEFFELGSYIFQMFTLFMQSIFASSELERIVTGIILIIISVFLLVIGNLRSKKAIWISALVFMLLELFIRLIVVIVLIPWWAYIGIIGIVLMGIASFIIYKNSTKN